MLMVRILGVAAEPQAVWQPKELDWQNSVTTGVSHNTRVPVRADVVLR